MQIFSTGNSSNIINDILDLSLVAKITIFTIYMYMHMYACDKHMSLMINNFKSTGM